MIVLDASALIALLDSTDRHHRTIAQALDGHALDEWSIGALTLAEVMVRAASSGDLFAELGEDLAELDLRVLPLGDADVEALARLRARTGLRMPDCCVLHAAHSIGGTLLTTDRALAARADELGVAVLP